MAVKTVVYPGSFDPPTLGHLDILRRAATVFEQVVVLIAFNSSKPGLFSLEQKTELLQAMVAPFSNVKVDFWQGLTIEYLRQNNLSILIRGIRGTDDWEFENRLAGMNSALFENCETLFLKTAGELQPISSSFVRDIMRHGGNWEPFVPAETIPLIRNFNRM